VSLLLDGLLEPVDHVPAELAVEDHLAAPPARVLVVDELEHEVPLGRQVGTADEIRATTDPVVRQFIEGRPDAVIAAGTGRE
jgi:hypothetical protein